MTIWRLRLVFLALGVALAIPGALLVRRALASVALEREARDRAVAERAFDEMERALTELLRAEEQRAASDYDFASEASPLRQPPSGSLARGYFQIEADGRVSAPAWAASVVPLAERVAAEGARLESVRGSPEPPRKDGAPPRAKPVAAPAAGALASAPAPLPEQSAPLAPAGAVAPAPAQPAVVEDAALPEPVAAEAKAEAAPEAEPARDAYDALAKLNVASKEREQRVQRVYVEQQPARAAAEERGLGHASAQAEGAEVPSTDGASASRAVAEQIVSDAFAPPAPAEPSGRPAEVSGAAQPTPAAQPQPASEPARDAARAPLERDAAPAPDARPGAGEPAGEKRDAAARRVEPARAAGLARPPAPLDAGVLLRVVVDPLRGRLAPGGELLLVRTAWIGSRGVRQGLALDISRLERALAERTLASGALPGATLRLAPRAALAAEAPVAARSAYTHRFAEPFEALGARLELAPFADPGARNVRWLAALFAFAGIAGLAAVYRMVALALHFAQRRSNFAAAVSHELKTPLTSIRMYAEMLRDGLVANDAKRSEYYGSITSEAERLSRLIDNVLEFSRLERGTRTLELRVGDVGPVVREAVELLGSHASARGLGVELALEDGLPPVRFERDALLQVLFNLIDNAIKYGRGEPARIEVACRRAGGGVAISVRDHGPGVPREELTRILEPFYRRGDELTRSAPGAGIGLALVKALAEQMGAALAVANAEGGGFAATLELAGGTT